MTLCPKCGQEQHCGCPTCHKEGRVEYKWDDTGYLISCGKCGFTMHCDQWLELDMREAVKEKNMR